jgi:hypothetical protein
MSLISSVVGGFFSGGAGILPFTLSASAAGPFWPGARPLFKTLELRKNDVAPT